MKASLFRRAPLAGVTLGALLVLPSAAMAAPGNGTDPSNPSLDQYVESVPSSHGDHPKPPSGGSSHGGQLSASVRHRINAHGGADAKQLQAVATSPALGAPTSSSAGSGGGGGAGSGSGGGGGSAGGGQSGADTPSVADEGGPSSLSAITSAASHGDGSSIGVLVAGLLLISAVAVGLALVRRRSYLT